jgi:hypothetical protein
MSFFLGFGNELTKLALTRAAKEMIKKVPTSRRLTTAMRQLHRASGKLSSGKRKSEIDKLMNKIERKMAPGQRKIYESGLQ